MEHNVLKVDRLLHTNFGKNPLIDEILIINPAKNLDEIQYCQRMKYLTIYFFIGIILGSNNCSIDL